jgi:hypothetical protein
MGSLDTGRRKTKQKNTTEEKGTNNRDTTKKRLESGGRQW